MQQVREKLPQSRSDAKAIGAARYFTGEPCILGHIDERNTASGKCYQCMRDRQKLRMATDLEYREKHRTWVREAARERLKDPAYVEQRRVQDLVKYWTCEDYRKKKAEADRLRNQREDAKARRRELQRIRYREKLANDPKHLADRKERAAKWAKEHSDRANAKTAARRAARKQATPSWLTDEHKTQMLDFYVRAKSLTKQSGVPHEVDHIYPLNGETVCGLHVPWNLQILTATENRAKANLLPEEHHASRRHNAVAR